MLILESLGRLVKDGVARASQTEVGFLLRGRLRTLVEIK
jgi:hypothetical protein